jgi:hypothetical protein
MATGFKSGGRKKGTANIVSGTVKEMLKASMTLELQSLPSLLSQLKAKDRVDSLIKLLPFIIPRAEESAVGSGKTMMEDHTAWVKKITGVMENERKQGAN